MKYMVIIFVEDVLYVCMYVLYVVEKNEKW